MKKAICTEQTQYTQKIPGMKCIENAYQLLCREKCTYTVIQRQNVQQSKYIKKRNATMNRTIWDPFCITLFQFHIKALTNLSSIIFFGQEDQNNKYSIIATISQYKYRIRFWDRNQRLFFVCVRLSFVFVLRFCSKTF